MTVFPMRQRGTTGRPAWWLTIVAALAVLAAMAPTSPRAATVTVEGFTEDGAAVVSFTGIIDTGDAERVLAATATLQRVVVVLESKGGQVGEAIKIGSIFRSRAFATYVPESSICLSMCGILWLSGQSRLVDWAGRIGFHAAYNREDKAISGSANAMIGAFLHSLGIGYEMISFATKAPPNTFAWLTVEKAAKMGFTFSVALPEQVQVKQRRPAPATLAPVAATPNGRRYGCDLPTAKLISETIGKDREAREAVFKEFGGAMNRACSPVPEGATLVVEAFHTEIPLACVRQADGTPCLWMQLGDIAVTPGRPLPGPDPKGPAPSSAPAPSALLALPGLDVRTTVATRLAAMSEREVCQMFLAGEQASSPEFYGLLVGEVRKRKLTTDRCDAGETCADASRAATARAVHALACQDKVSALTLTELCSAGLETGGTEWRDSPAFYWIRLEARQRMVEPADCRKLLSQPVSTAAGTVPSPLETAVREALPGLSEAQKERIAKSYAATPGRRALARSDKGTWRTSTVANPDEPDMIALEACQLYYAMPCWLVAVDDTVKPAKALGSDSARDMPKLSYEGTFDRGRIPAISRSRRFSKDVADYPSAPAGKASAIHARGIFVVVTGAASAFEAERQALDMCAAAVAATPPAEPCLLYSSGDEVVLVRRSNQPMSRQQGSPSPG